MRNANKYVMRNEETGIEITTTSNHLVEWLSRGFEVVKIVTPSGE